MGVGAVEFDAEVEVDLVAAPSLRASTSSQSSNARPWPRRRAGGSRGRRHRGSGPRRGCERCGSLRRRRRLPLRPRKRRRAGSPPRAASRRPGGRRTPRRRGRCAGPSWRRRPGPSPAAAARGSRAHPCTSRRIGGYAEGRRGGSELYYERAGSGEPLLLIQGMSATHLAWGEPFLALLEQSFECIVFDNRGMGLSRPARMPFTIAEMAADTAGAARRAGDRERPRARDLDGRDDRPGAGPRPPRADPLADPRLRPTAAAPRAHADGPRGPAGARRGDAPRATPSGSSGRCRSSTSPPASAPRRAASRPSPRWRTRCRRRAR